MTFAFPVVASAAPQCPGCGLGDPCPAACGENACLCDTGETCVCQPVPDTASEEPAIDAAERTTGADDGAADIDDEAAHNDDEEPHADDEPHTDDAVIEANESGGNDDGSDGESAGSGSGLLVGAGLGLLVLAGGLAFLFGRKKQEEPTDTDTA